MTLPRVLHDLDEVLAARPALSTSTLRDATSGLERDRALVPAAPTLGPTPEVGSISTEQAEADMTAAIESAKQRRWWVGAPNTEGVDSCCVVESSR